MLQVIGIGIIYINYENWVQFLKERLLFVALDHGMQTFIALDSAKKSSRPENKHIF